jgi:hypothetical protein
MKVPGINTSGSHEDGFTLTPDGLTAYVSVQHSSSFDIKKYTRASITHSFSDAGYVSVLNTNLDERKPALDNTSAGGPYLYFERRTLALGVDDLNIYRAQWNGSGWNSPQPDTGVSKTTSNEADSNFIGYQFTFSSDRSGGTGGWDTYYWNGAVASFGQPVNSPANDVSPVLSSDGKLLFLGSNRSGSQSYDIYWTTRFGATSQFTATPVKVPNLNSTGIDVPLHLSADSCTLYFVSDRDGTYDIFYVKRL